MPAATQKFALDYGAVTFREAMTEFDKAFAAYVRQYEDTDFDAYVGPEFIFPAGMFEALAWNRVRLPGVHLPGDKSFQFVEAEYMKAEEYDEYLDDPSDWVLRKYLPRLSPKLEPLAQLPPLRNMLVFHQGLPDLVLAAAENPGVVDAMKALQASGEAVQEWYEYLGRIDQELGGRLGIPHLLGAIAAAPFDIISTYYRGWRGAIVDMYTQPEKMKALMERLLPWQLQYGIDGAKALGHPIVTVYLYKGADGLMSDEQYEEFYWPTLKKLHPRPGRRGSARVGLHARQVRLAPAPLQGDPRGDVPHPPRERHRRLPGEGGAGGLAVHRGQRLQRAAGHGVRRRGRGLLPETRRGLRQGRRLHDGLLGLPRRGQAGERQEDDRGREALWEIIVMIKGVLFDKDGTLLEFHSTQHYIYATLLACLKDELPGP